MSTNPDGCYGSGKRIIDEMKEASAVAALDALISIATNGGQSWESLEARIGREAIRLWEIRKRLAAE